ncbi:MAG: hypothetical protein WDZ79_00110 [Candidatus Paceibacterota bacterium]
MPSPEFESFSTEQERLKVNGVEDVIQAEHERFNGDPLLSHLAEATTLAAAKHA